MSVQFSDFEFAYRHGSQYSLDRTSYQEGAWNIATDTGSLSIDIEGKRVHLTDIITGYSELQIRAITEPTSKVYLANDTYNLLVFDSAGATWRRCSGELVLQAERAVKDEEGNNIVNTYMTIESASSEFTRLGNLLELLQTRVATINKFDVRILDNEESLPEYGEKFVIYFVPQESENKDDIENSSNIYAEYIWIETPNTENNENNGETPENPENPEEPGEGDDNGDENPEVPVGGDEDPDEPDPTDPDTPDDPSDPGDEPTEPTEPTEPEEETPTPGYYEQIGLTSLDLGNYYNKFQTYNRSEIEDLISQSETTASTTYTKVEDSVASIEITNGLVTLYNANGEVLSSNTIDLSGAAVTNLDFGEEVANPTPEPEPEEPDPDNPTPEPEPEVNDGE